MGQELKVINEKLKAILEQIEDQDKEIAKIHKILYGNGKPKGSIVDRMARFETRLKLIFAILLMIAGTIIRLAFF